MISHSNMPINKATSYTSFFRFLKYAKPWRGKIILSTLYSIINKLFDIAPEILIGIAVDLVVQKNDSIIANLGFTSLKAQITFLAIATFLIWLFESTPNSISLTKFFQSS